MPGLLSAAVCAALGALDAPPYQLISACTCARVCVYGLTQFCVHNSFASCVHDTDTLLKNENCCLLNHRCWAPIRRHRPWPGAEGTRDRDGATALRRTASGLNLVARCDEWAVQGPNQFYKKFKLW